LNKLVLLYSNRSIFKSWEWKNISFLEEGKYLVSVKIYLENYQLFYEEELNVLGGNI